MTIRCPKCNVELDATEDCVGQQVECPQCGHAFVVRLRPSRIQVPAAAVSARNSEQQKQAGHGRLLMILGAIGFGVIVVAAVVVFALPNKTPTVNRPVVSEAPIEEGRQPDVSAEDDDTTEVPSAAEEPEKENPSNVPVKSVVPPKAPSTPVRAWMAKLPHVGSGLEISDTSFAKFVQGDFNPPITERLIAYPFRFPYHPWQDQEDVSFDVVENVTVEGLPALLLRANIVRWENKLKNAQIGAAIDEPREKLEDRIYRARRDFCIITDSEYAPGEKLEAGLFIPFGQYDLKTETGYIKRVLLFAENLDDTNAFEANLKRKEADLDASRPQLDEFLGVAFGDVVPGKKHGFVFKKDRGAKGLEYQFTPRKKFRKFDYYCVWTTPKSDKVYRIIARCGCGAVPVHAQNHERNEVRTILQTKYGAPEINERKGFKYQMRNGRYIFIAKNNWDEDMLLEAVDTTMIAVAEKESLEVEAERKAKHRKELKSDVDAL